MPPKTFGGNKNKEFLEKRRRALQRSSECQPLFQIFHHFYVLFIYKSLAHILFRDQSFWLEAALKCSNICYRFIYSCNRIVVIVIVIADRMFSDFIPLL